MLVVGVCVLVGEQLLYKEKVKRREEDWVKAMEDRLPLCIFITDAISSLFSPMDNRQGYQFLFLYVLNLMAFFKMSLGLNLDFIQIKF